MSRDIVPVSVKILDKEFQVACPPEEQESLRASAKLLDRKMREIRDSNRVIGTDRIAIMAALNLAHELLQVSTENLDAGETVSMRIKTIQNKLQTALFRNSQMEL